MKIDARPFFPTLLLICVFAVATLSSCIHDDTEDCPLIIDFNYSYNIKNANAFELEASRVKVWLFGTDGKFISQYIDEGSHIDNAYRMEIPHLPPGEYTLVAWARSCAQTHEYATCLFPELTPGISTVEDLHARFRRQAEDISDVEFNALLNGTQQVTFSNTGPVYCTINLMKVTNKVRVLLMPVGSEGVSAEKYDFLIQDDNGWLNCSGNKYASDAITYKPYYAETLFPPESRANDGSLQSVAVASLHTSRFFYGDSPRFSVVDRESGEEKFVLENLTWYLSLLATLEHSDRWDAQEYLDREDYYDITIYVDGDTFMKNKIVIKDWVISIDDDIEL